MSRHDRAFLAWFVAYSVLGTVTNYLRMSDAVSVETKGLVGLAATAALLAWICFLAWSVLSGRRTLSELGFALDSWPAVTVAVVATVAGVAVFLRLPSPSPPSLVGYIVAAVLVEEILFRPLLIPILAKVFASSSRPLVPAALLAAALWALPHLASKAPGQVFGVFTGGLVFNALYALTGSNVAGVVLHAAANGGGQGALAALGLCLLFAGASPMLSRRR